MSPRLHHLTLSVTDATASATWYQELLGAAQVVERELPGGRRIRLAWPDGLVIGVTEFDARTDETFSHLRTGLDHVGLACDSEAEVRAWAETIAPGLHPRSRGGGSLRMGGHGPGPRQHPRRILLPPSPLGRRCGRATIRVILAPRETRRR